MGEKPIAIAVSNDTEDDSVAESLAESISSSTRVREISMHRCYLGDSTIAALDSMLSLQVSHSEVIEQVSIINCLGQVERAAKLVIDSDCVASLCITRNVENGEWNYDSVGKSLSKSQILTKLRITGPLEGYNLNTLAHGVATSKRISSLDFSWSTFDTAAVESLVEGLAQNAAIESLCLASCGLTDSQGAMLIGSLVGNPELADLNLSGNHLGPQSSQAIAKLLGHVKCRVKKLDLSFQRPQSDVEKFELTHIAEALSSSNESLKILEIASCGLGDEDCKRLSLMLCHNSHLNELYLQRNLIGNEGIAAMGRAMPSFRSLRRLSLWGNKFDENGALELVEGLRLNTDIVELDLFRQFQCSDFLLYLTCINRAGRRMILNYDPNDVPVGLWPRILQHANKVKLTKKRDHRAEQCRIDMVFYLIKNMISFLNT